jgi:hypothetical protein
MVAVARWARAFGRFWFDFLFGDSPVLFPATLAIVGVAFALHHDRPAAVVMVPLLVIVLIVGSAYLGRRKSTERERPVKARQPR